MPGISVRYIVDDVDAAVEFYTGHLGFSVALRPAPAFAILTRDGFRLLVSGTTGPGGAAQTMPDGRKPEPGGSIAFRSRSTISRRGSRCCAKPGCGFGTKSSKVQAESKSSSKIPREIRSNSSKHQAIRLFELASSLFTPNIFLRRAPAPLEFHAVRTFSTRSVESGPCRALWPSLQQVSD